MNILIRIPFVTTVYITLSILLLGCNNRNPPELHKFETPRFVNEWLKDSSELPRWYGIIPGQTNLSEANRILSSIPEINYIEAISGAGDADDRGNLRFDVTGGGYRIIGGALIYDFDDEIVEEIQYFAGDSLSLQNVIEVFGEPSFITANATNYDNDEYVSTVQIYFLDEGVLLDWGDFLDQNKQLSLDPNQVNLNVTFLDPDMIKSMVSDPDILFQEWPGFVSLEATCEDRTCELTPTIQK